MDIKAAGKLRQEALVGVTIFAVQECVRWAIDSWFLTLGGEAGAVHRNPSPMGKEDIISHGTGVNLGEHAGYTKM